MFGLPISTERKQQLPKKAVYAKFGFTPSQRESFDADVARMDIVAVISPMSVPALKSGEEVKEFYVLAIQMKRKEYDVKNIILLTRLIPQKMVFALQYGNETQFAIFHTKLITSVWQQTDEATLQLSGINLDTIWENIVKDIGQIEVADGNTLAEQITTDDRQAKLHAQIETFKRKMAKEMRISVDSHPGISVITTH